MGRSSEERNLRQEQLFSHVEYSVEDGTFYFMFSNLTPNAWRRIQLLGVETWGGGSYQKCEV